MTNIITFILLAISINTQASEISELLQKSLKAHEDAQTYLEWGTSPFHPHQIFSKYATSSERSKISSELCQALAPMSPEDRSVFYSELSEWSYEQDLPCLNTLMVKTKIYYELKSAQLYVNYLIQNMEAEIYQDKPAKKLGPSRVESVDATGGPIYYYGDRGGLGKKELALTFDDGPHPHLTPDLLDILKNENVQATFFTVGKNVKSYSSIVAEIVNQGHTLGTHSYSHQNLPTLKLTSAYNEIDSGFQMALNVTGSVAPFFRFPYGSKNKILTEYVKQSDFASFFWDVDTLDWKKKDPKVLLDFVLDEIEATKNGIVLFHDVQPQTIAIMPTLLAELKTRGYKLVVYTPTEWIVNNKTRKP